MVYNALCAIICGEHFDLEHNEIYKGLKNAKLTKGRLEKFNLKCGATVINDAYNASPDSMRGAFNLLVESKLNEHNTTLILGDMFELGEESAKMHRALGDYLGEQCFYDVIFCGNLMKNAYDGLDKRFCIHLKSIDEIIPELERRGINEKSNLFFKASNGMNFKKVVEELREKF